MVFALRKLCVAYNNVFNFYAVSRGIVLVNVCVSRFTNMQYANLYMLL